MTTGRGHQSIYFKDPAVLETLEHLSEKDLGGEVSVSSIVCEVMGKVVPELVKAVKKGKRRDIPISVSINL